MDIRKVQSLIDEESYAKVFEILDESYETMHEKSTYNRLKKEFKKGVKDLDYEDRLKTFVNDLKKQLPESSENNSNKEQGRTIHTQNYFENVENINLDQRNTKDA